MSRWVAAGLLLALLATSGFVTVSDRMLSIAPSVAGFTQFTVWTNLGSHLNTATQTVWTNDGANLE